MDYQNICDEVLELDKKIRYVGVYDYGELYDKIRPGLQSYLTKEETEIALSQAVYRWSTRKKTASKIGNPIFAMAKYEKIYRITLSIGGAGLVLVSTDIDIDINDTLEKLSKLTSKYAQG